MVFPHYANVNVPLNAKSSRKPYHSQECDKYAVLACWANFVRTDSWDTYNVYICGLRLMVDSVSKDCEWHFQ